MSFRNDMLQPVKDSPLFKQRGKSPHVSVSYRSLNQVGLADSYTGRIGPPTLHGLGIWSKPYKIASSQSDAATQSSSIKATYIPFAFLYPRFLACPNP